MQFSPDIIVSPILKLGSVLYVELLTDFERIGDHILNIAQSYAKIENR